MYPDNQQPQYSVDYLNQIAAPAQKPGFFDKKTKIIVIILGILMLLSVPLIIVGILNSTDRVTADQVALHLKTLEVVSNENHGNIGNGELRSVNSSLSLVLADATGDLSAYSVDPNSLTAMVEADPRAIELRDKLDDATLNAVIDRTYPREMAYQLEVALLDLERLYNESNNPEFRNAIGEVYEQIEPIQEQFEEISAASE